MHGRGGIFLLAVLVAVAIPIHWAFNIDMKDPHFYFGEKNDFFGYKVLQFMSGTRKGILIAAPLQLNGSGAICKREDNQIDHCFSPSDMSFGNSLVQSKYFGLSIAEHSTAGTSPEFTVCSPSVAHECYGNSYLNSVCYKMTDQLRPTSSFAPAFQACKKKTVDLVFLFDGSASMTTKEFNMNKKFIEDIMESLTNTSIKFAAVQFSNKPRKVFNFKDYEAGDAVKKLHQEPHMKSLTNTHLALTFVLEQIFENPTSGASLDAIRVVVLITDGDPSDNNIDIIERYDDKKIIRFVIGVKVTTLDKFSKIASEPNQKHAFKIENYNGLTGVLENFQKKVFDLEGTKVARAGEMTNEMSQTGFSAALYKDTLILGSVGKNSWRGSLHELNGEIETDIEVPHMQMDSYMGYSVSVGERKNVPLYFTGAPRFQHTGQVVVFKHNGESWYTAQRVNGDKFGSYFGAMLCSIDINADGDTDFLLVGAPMFYQPQMKREGQIYVYRLTKEGKLIKQLEVMAPSMGRFGTTISSLADMNGDGLRDVAVGAPLEDDNRGVVYIYLGDKNKGMRSSFSQKIMGQKIHPGLKFFGQAIDGDIDLGEDGLPDIVVGSQGTAVAFRSKPVFNVIASLSFQPEEISTENIDCWGRKDSILPMVALKACFKVEEMTRSKAAAHNSGLNISYTLDVDPTRQIFRGFFSQTDKKARKLTSTLNYMLSNNDNCFNHSIYMPKCVKDTLSPISVKLQFYQDESENASAVLNVDSKRQAAVEIPFEKQCKENDTCIAELEVDFSFMTPTLLVTEDNYFNLSIELSNPGDDSYNTSLTMDYPPCLSFSRMTVTKSSRPVVHRCHGESTLLNQTICGISLPVYRSKSVTTFLTSCLILTDYDWSDTISITITGNSDNSNSTRANSLTKSIPVQFEVKMAVTVKEDTSNYMTFTTENTAPQKIVASYKIDNLGFKTFPVNVSLFFPTRLEHELNDSTTYLTMSNYTVIVPQNATKCDITTDKQSEYCSSEKHCKIIKCDSFLLEKESSVDFILSGDVQFKDLEQHEKNLAFLKKYTGDSAEVEFKSFIHVDYDKQQYVLNPFRQEEESNESSLGMKKDPTRKQTKVRIEFIIPPNKRMIISTGVGVGLLVLIIITVIMCKLGCFKRKKIEDYQAIEDAANQADNPTESSPLPTNGTVSQSDADPKSEQPQQEETEEEEENLLDNGEANNISCKLIDEAEPDRMATEATCND